MLLIQTWGGIGDILRELSAFPHATLFRLFHLRWKVRHVSRESLRLHPEALAPDAALVRQLVERCSSLVWDGAGKGSRGERAGSRVIRNLTSLFSDSLFSPGFQLTREEEAGLPPTTAPLRIGLQTHLLGLPSKKWELKKWEAVVRGCLANYPQATLYLLEPDESARQLVVNERVLWCGQLNILQSIRLVERLDLLVSIDSWAKYPAAWSGVPQIIIVPDQTGDYREADAESVWTHSFRGIAGKPEVKLIGLEKKSGTARYTVSSLQDLSAEQVMAAICDLRVTSRT